MAHILLAYSTTDGHTGQICERLRQVLESHGHHATVRLIKDCGAADLEACDAVVIGASIRYGKHKPEVAAFIARHQAALEDSGIPSAGVSMTSSTASTAMTIRAVPTRCWPWP